MKPWNARPAATKADRAEQARKAYGSAVMDRLRKINPDAAMQLAERGIELGLWNDVNYWRVCEGASPLDVAQYLAIRHDGKIS